MAKINIPLGADKATQMAIQKLSAQLFNPLSNDRIVYYTDGQFTSINDLTQWVAGTTNQVSVANDGDGTVTLSLPQNIHTGASPTFVTVDLTGITDNYIPYMSASGLANSSFFSAGGGTWKLTESRAAGLVTLWVQNTDTTGFGRFLAHDGGRAISFEAIGENYAASSIGDVREVKSGVIYSSSVNLNICSNNGAAPIKFFTGGDTAIYERIRITYDGGLLIKELAAAVTDVAGFGQLWVKSDTPNTLWFTDDTGTDRQIAPQDLSTTSSPVFAGIDIQHATLPTLTLTNLQNDNNWAAVTEWAKLNFYTSDTSGIGAHVAASIAIVHDNGAGGSPSAAIVFSNNINNVAAIERLRITSGGNIGVGGIAIPVSLFEIQGGLTTVGSVLTLSSKETSTVANDILGRIDFRAALDASGGDALLNGASIAAVAESTFSATVNETGLQFSTGASEVAVERMRIDHKGNVGIGTTTPGVLTGGATYHGYNVLHVKGGSRAYSVLAATDYVISVWENTGGTAGRNVLQTALYSNMVTFTFQSSNDGTVYSRPLTLLASGNVGIGISTPYTKLTVEGALTLKEQANADADTAAYGQIWIKSDTPNILKYTDDAGTDFSVAMLNGISGSFTTVDLKTVTVVNGLITAIV